MSGLIAIGSSIGTRAIALATDDEAAVLLAEHAEQLGQTFILPSNPPALPGQLATKHTLHALCVQHGVPTPLSISPDTPAEAYEIARTLGFPLVVKNDEAWRRLTDPGVASTTIVRTLPELERLIGSWANMPSVVLQEYLPREHATDWIAHAYVGRQPGRSVVFTGRKLRSWPPHAGVTTSAYTCSNAELAELTTEFCREVGFQGICDVDWRFDARSHRYNLVDFNPRLGAQFRLFETENGLDVVRVMHLDLTGREVSIGHQVDGRFYRVENLDLPAAVAYRFSGGSEAATVPRRRGELGWWAADDPVPALIAYWESAVVGAKKLSALRRLARRAIPAG